jgi:hypothetical protein
VIVTSALPPGINGSGRLGEVMICDFSLAAHLAEGFRRMLITTDLVDFRLLKR